MASPRLLALSVLVVSLCPASGSAQVVMAPGAGSDPVVRVINPDGTEASFLAYDAAFQGGVRVALGDVNGDGIVDIITGAGPTGGPHVKVFSGADLSLLASFFAYDPVFTGGVYVAAGDVNGDGRADIITGAGAGDGPLVNVFSGADLSVLASFLAYTPAHQGGVFVAAGDVNGDGRADIITGAGAGGGPHVRVFSGVDLSDLASFFAYDTSFTGGVSVASLDADGDGLADIITGAGPGGGPHVRVFSGADLSNLWSFYAYDPLFSGGVFVAAADFDGDGQPDIVTGPGPGGGPHVRVFRATDLADLASFYAFNPFFAGGIFIGSLPGGGGGLRFTSPATTTFTAGSPGTFTVTTLGTPVPAITQSGTLPAGVTFTDNGDGTATLAGTPGAGTGDAYVLTFTADNGTGTPATQTFTLNVHQVPAFTSAAATNFTAGAPGTFQVTTTGFPRPSITRSGASLPSGVNWVDNGNGTGTLSGTPAAGTSGAYSITFTADNGVTPPALQSFTLTVSGAPTFTSGTSTTFTVGSPGSFTVTTVGTPTPAITVGALPAGVTFVANPDGTGTLSGTPAAGTGGAHTLTFTAANGVAPNATQTFTLNINQAPAITSASSVTFTLGAPNTFTVTTTGFPAPTLTQGGTLPAGVNWVDNGNGTGTLSGTPQAGTGGVHALTFTAANGGGSAVQNFTLTITQPPAITSANTATFTLNTAGTTFQVTMTGVPPPTVSVTSGVLPTGLTLSSAGLLSGTPTQSGSFPVTLTATNGTLPNATQAFTVVVNAPPAITSANATTFTVGSAGSFTVVMTGFPAPTVSVTAGTLPAGVTLSPAGVLSGTPDPGTGGVYNVTLTATNGVGSNAVQAFTLTVNQVPAFTSAAATAFTVGVAGTFSITTSGFPAITTITRGGVALPAGVNYTDNADGTATLAGTSAAGTGGTYALTFTINNGVGGNVVQNFTLTINAPPAITSANATTFTVGTPGTFTVTTTGFPAPTVSQTGTLPTGVTFTPATKVLAGTATQTGAFPLVFTATNAIPPDATQNFTLNVVCPTITVNPATAMPEGLFMVAYGGATFTQAGSTGSSITWSATGLPAGLAISPTTGVVSGTPTTTVLIAAVAVTATDNFGCFGTRNTTITVRPVAGADSFTGGVGNTQYVVGTAVTTPAVAKAGNVKSNDNGPGTLTVTFNAPASGTVTEGPTDGTFVYTPNVAFGGPTDIFTYTLTDGNGVTNTGTVTISLSGMVWYVNSGPTNGDGRSHSPFNTLNAAATPSASGSQIYVHTGTATTTGDLTMDQNQTLHGAGSAFALNDLAIAAGTRPTLSGTVTLANNDIVRAVNFSGAATALSVPAGAYTAAMLIDQVNVTLGTTGLQVGAATATGAAALTVSNATFTNTGGAEISMNGGNLPVTFPATTTISSNAGRSIDIQNRTGGAVSFAGAITDTGTGILLNNNGTSTFSFTGGLTLNGASSTFTATNPSLAGTLTITGTNTIGATTAPTSGTALNVTNVTIGAGGLTFRSISANGVTNGIVLSNTGATAGLTVTGNGGTCTPAAPTCTGGRIQNTTGADNSTATPGGTGIVLNNTRSVSLSLMRLDNHSNYAIRGTSVEGFSLANSLVDGANGTNVSTPFNDGSLVFFGVTGTSSGMTGTSSITNSTIQGGFQRNIAIDNSVGTLNLTVSGNTIRRTSDAAGDDGFFLEADTTANVTVAITNNTFARHGGDHINLTMVNNAVMDATITGNTLNGNYTGTPEGNHPIGLGQGILLFGASFNGTFTYDVSNNTIKGNRQGGSIHVNKGSGTATFSGSIENNVIGDAAIVGSGSAEAFGIIVGARGAGGSHTTLINNNQVRQYFDRGIVLQAGEGSAALNATVTNNTVSNFADAVNSLHGIHSDNGILSTDSNAVCLNISGNSVATAGNEAGGGADIRLRRATAGSVTVRLPGLAGTTNAAATTLLQANNPTATTITVTGNGFSGGAACPVPQ